MRRAVPVAALVAAALAAAVVLLGGGDGARVVEVELRDARGLLEGGDVRIAGAPAGRVDELALTRRGTARARLVLDEGVPAPRADAAVVVRPVDLLGDTVLDLDPGTAAAPLRGAIRPARATSAPRLDEVLGILDPGGRAGLRALLVAGGQALAGRGATLARTTAELQGTLRAADATFGELQSQNAALRELVADADRAAGQVDDRRGDLDRVLAGLDRTLAATDRRREPLRQGLERLPATLDEVRSTSAQLRSAARAATPVARDLAAHAPRIAGAVRELAPFLTRLRPAAGELREAVRPLRAVLRDGAPGLDGLASGLARLRHAVPDVDALLEAVEPAAPKFSEGFFVNFADQGAEPGKQPLDPFTDTRRGYWRGAAVLSCEAFGIEVGPGCLLKAPGVGSLETRRRTRRQPAGKPAPAAPRPSAPKALEPITKPLERGAGQLGRGADELRQGTTDGVRRLLDLLLGP